MKKTILSLAMLLLASAGFAQCGKNAGYEVKAENAIPTTMCVMPAILVTQRIMTPSVFVVSSPSKR